MRLAMTISDFIGDKVIGMEQTQDLCDSLFTRAGKIDGFIAYEDYYQFIVDHPVVQLWMSTQFQGSGMDKYRSMIHFEGQVSIRPLHRVYQIFVFWLSRRATCPGQLHTWLRGNNEPLP